MRSDPVALEGFCNDPRTRRVYIYIHSDKSLYGETENIDLSFGRFRAGFRPKLAPEPSPTAPARKTIHQRNIPRETDSKAGS